jgi:hypothetical protein
MKNSTSCLEEINKNFKKRIDKNFNPEEEERRDVKNDFKFKYNREDEELIQK